MSTFEAKRIFIRPLKESDVTDQYVGYYQNAELVKYMYQTPRVIDRAHLVKELSHGEESGQYYMYGVFDKTNDFCIGHIRIGLITGVHKISDLAIFIGNTEYLGKGFAQETIELGNRVCFEKFDFRKLHGGMFEGNIASIRAYLKAGWVVEGRLRGQYLVDGKTMDRITVACFNPKYFSAEFLAKVKSDSDKHLNDYFPAQRE